MTSAPMPVAALGDLQRLLLPLWNAIETVNQPGQPTVTFAVEPQPDGSMCLRITSKATRQIARLLAALAPSAPASRGARKGA